MNKILECKNLKKKFGNKEILKDVSFSIEEGDILAFIGPNGSGKTTTIKLILGLQTITSGEVIINGFDLKTDFVKAISKVGAIVENPDSYMHLTGYENLLLISNMYKESKSKLDELIKLVGLEARINDKVSKYSLGMRQRLGIAKALIMNPNLLILDEPTNGLDPEGIHELRIILKNLAKQKIGILISSHNLTELESFCNKICIIKNGHIIDYINKESLNNESNRYIFKVSDTKLLNIENIEIISNNSFEICCLKENINKVIKSILEKNINIYEITPKKTSLEDAFLQRTGGNKID